MTKVVGRDVGHVDATQTGVRSATSGEQRGDTRSAPKQTWDRAPNRLVPRPVSRRVARCRVFPVPCRTPWLGLCFSKPGPPPPPLGSSSCFVSFILGSMAGKRGRSYVSNPWLREEAAQRVCAAPSAMRGAFISTCGVAIPQTGCHVTVRGTRQHIVSTVAAHSMHKRALCAGGAKGLLSGNTLAREDGPPLKQRVLVQEEEVRA